MSVVNVDNCVNDPNYAEGFNLYYMKIAEWLERKGAAFTWKWFEFIFSIWLEKIFFIRSKAEKTNDTSTG